MPASTTFSVPEYPAPGTHDHRFGQDRVRPGQGRTVIVLGLTLLMMVAEMVAGSVYGSIALWADGLHMGSHAAALAVALLAYGLTRRHADDRRFSFGVGKVNALAGFASAMLLGVVALLMILESLQRWRSPLPISVNEALVVAMIGLAVNGVSALLLMQAEAPAASQPHGHDSLGHPVHQDDNLRAAYLHVLADALTSVLAIVALLAAKVADILWMDPLMGVIGGAIVLHWSAGLLKATGQVLLDRQAPTAQLAAVQAAIESQPGDRLVDLHLWSIGTGLWAAELTVESEDPQPPDSYRARLPASLLLAHAVVEVRGLTR